MRTLTTHLIALSACLVLLMLFTPAFSQSERIKVAIFVGGGTEPDEFLKEFRNTADDSIYWERIYNDDIRNGALDNFDALVIPGGSAISESRSMGAIARQNIRRFVSQGGIYLGVCAGGYLASSDDTTDLGFFPLETADGDHWYRVDPDNGPLIDIELTKAGMEIFGINQNRIKLIYENGPIFAPAAQKSENTFTTLAYFRSEVVGDGGQPGVMINSPAIILAQYGKGSVLSISPHPEETPGYKQAEIHAIHWLYDHRPGSSSKTTSQPITTAPPQSNPNGHVSSSKMVSQPVTTVPGPSRGALHAPAQNTQATPPQTNPNGPASPLSEQALKLAESIFDNATDVKYVHHEVPASQQIEKESDGTLEAHTDCSGFISYIVHAVAPRHYQEVRSREPDWSYPQAKIWATFFNSLDSGAPEGGWLRIDNWKDLRPGDIAAWKEVGGENTGHVMMVMNRPGNIQENNGYRYVELPVIDSSTTYHFTPEYLPPKAGQKHRNGVGMGVIRLMLSDDDKVTGYWAGTYWGEGDKPIKGPANCNMIRFARLMPMTAND
ncbi:MAG: hypothetical protein K2Y22_09720 [Candidatus Obscuribacterales bacterium]|nr:hypothetical protein [Candidatus Obscuribacterales bacterium]